MKTITFCREGEKVSDYDVYKWVDNFFASTEETFKISNVMPIHEVRARVKEGRIKEEDVKVLVEDNKGEVSEFKIDKNGRSGDWVDSMELYGDILMRII